ncbi:MAG: ATP synthase F0 subunit B [Candidatus Sericytochromatia bacterium]|nr:ATP synthase F0 subunit B [Candidatus Sericytochromatia bacterium]
MEFTNWHAIANVVNFLLFVIVIAKFAGPVIAQALEDSANATWTAIRTADEGRVAAEQTLAETQARLAHVDRELGELVAEARELASRQAAKLEAASREDAERLRASAQDEIARERQAAVQELRRVLLDQAFDRAGRDVRSAVTLDRQRALVSELIQKVGDGSLALK